MRKLQIVDVEVQSREHDANLGIQQRAVGDALEVLRGDVSSKLGIRAANVRDAF